MDGLNNDCDLWNGENCVKCEASEYTNRMEQYQHEVLDKPRPYAVVLMCPHMKGAIDLINALHEIVHIRDYNGAYWPNCVSRKKDTIQQSSAGVPISPLSKQDSGYGSLYHAINSMPDSTLKSSMLQALNPSRRLYHPKFPRTLQLMGFTQSHKQ